MSRFETRKSHLLLLSIKITKMNKHQNITFDDSAGFTLILLTNIRDKICRWQCHQGFHQGLSLHSDMSTLSKAYPKTTHFWKFWRNQAISENTTTQSLKVLTKPGNFSKWKHDFRTKNLHKNHAIFWNFWNFWRNSSYFC